MFQTATLTDLRYKAGKVVKGATEPVWIFDRGKKVGVIMNISLGEQVLQEWGGESESKGEKKRRKTKEFLAELKAHGPIHLDVKRAKFKLRNINFKKK
jgi:hypothetical protein